MRLDQAAIEKAYAGWAPFYDYSFGVIAAPGRNLAVRHINKLSGRVLEVGVGTGLSLPRYQSGLYVTGIELSAAMLAKAKNRVRRRNLDRKSLALMDAGRMAFADASFDAVAAMYVMTVVPDVAAVMAEIVRVLKPGGEAVIVNHFSRSDGLRGAFEHWLARYSHRLGWNPMFPIDRVMVPELDLLDKTDLPPAGLFTLLRFRKSMDMTQGPSFSID